MDNTPQLDQAANLAEWLIYTKNVKRKTAYIIAQKKYKLPYWEYVREAMNKAIKAKKPVQESLL